MILNLRMALIVILSVVLVGCATSSAIPLKPEATARIQSTRAHIVIVQQEINTEVARSNFGQAGANGAGLVGALIGSAIDASVESSRASKANLQIEPVRKQLDNFDFRAEYDRKFRTAMANQPWLKVDQIEITGKPYNAEDKDRTLASMTQNSLLVMEIEYRLSTDYRCLIVHSKVNFWQRGLDEPQYLGEYRYLSAPVSSKSGETAVLAWADNNAKLLRAALEEGIDETIHMLKLDFVSKAEPDPEDAPLGDAGKLRVVSLKASAGIYKGGTTTSRVDELASRILATDNDRVIFRSKFLNRYTVPGQIYSTTTRQRFELPATVSSAKPVGEVP